MAMSKAQRIQQSISTRINKLRKQNKLASKDFEHLDKHTHELYNLAKETNKLEGKLEEIKKIIERIL